MQQAVKEKKESERMLLQKKAIIQKLRANGCRITKQRMIILDIILEDECRCCKEIYYKALQYDDSIGSATVYRMVNTLEEIGAINRKNMYHIKSSSVNYCDKECIVTYDNDQTFSLEGEKWNQVLIEGLRACGYLKNHQVKCIDIS